MTDPLSRRRFLSGSTAALGASALGSNFLQSTLAFAATRQVRRNVTGMTAYDPVLVSYGKAVTAMQALPATNPLSWTYQAAIHGTLLGTPQTAWNSCQHGNYFFWSWHRMYLHCFERIIRKMCGDPCWTLPYWPWDQAAARQIPAPFRDSTNPLYTTNRDPTMNAGGSLPPGAVSYSTSFSQTDFTTAGNIFQGTPHGAVHVDIGGWMGSVPTAAQDPIFYLHHANCDRLWDLWLAQGGRSDPMTDSAWRTTPFTFFNAAGAQVTMKSCDVLRAAEQLGYVYEAEPAQVNENCLVRPRPPIWIFVEEELIKLPIPPITLEDAPVSFPVELKDLRERVAPEMESATDTLFLALDAEAERSPGIVWEVYLGLPSNATADPESASYLGNLALFGEGIRNEPHQHGKEFRPAHFLFPLKFALGAALRAADQRVSVTLIPQRVLLEGRPVQRKSQAAIDVLAAAIVVQRARKP